MADPGLLAGLLEVFVILDLGQHIRHRRHTGLVADPHGFDLVVHLLAQLGLGEPDIRPQFFRQAFGFLVEHQEHELGLATAPLDEIDDFFVLQQIVVDVFDALEFSVGLFRGAEHIGVLAAVAVDVADILKVFHPLIETKKVKVRGRDKVNRVFVTVKEPANFRDILENSRCHDIWSFA